MRYIWQRIKHWIMLGRIHRGMCPHCGKALEYSTLDGQALKSCPDKHYGVMSVSDNKILIIDAKGDPIDMLFDRKFTIIKNTDKIDKKMNKDT